MNLITHGSGYFVADFPLRRRSVWEAADSGILLWRSNFACLMLFFAVPVLIVASCLCFLPENLFFLSSLILWWLKPLFDRLALHVISVRFFASPEDSPFGVPAARRIKELSRGLWGTFHRALPGDLLWRRFNPGRAAYTAVRVLERVDKKRFQQRKRALVSGGLGFCTPMGVFCFILEGMLLFGELLFAILISEVLFPANSLLMQTDTTVLSFFIFAAFCFNYVLVESLYVCMSFGLYINSRVELEGWDLQLLFLKFADTAQVRETHRSIIKILPIVCLLFSQLIGSTLQPVYAEEAAEPFPMFFPTVSEGALGKLEEILSSDDFGSEKEGWGIRFKFSREEPGAPDLDIDSWFHEIRQVFGFILRIVVILALFGALVFSLYWLSRQRRRGLFPLRDTGKSYANPLMSGESPESLFAKAEDFFRKGNLREAWAAWLAGCLGAFTRDHSVSFPVDATEYGCLALAQSALGGKTDGFGEFVEDWILLAYGGRPPEPGVFEKALAFGRSLLRGADDEP
ncbi:MAG: hypothetical protein LBQ94_05945 [Treponema sp.]|jgi:hypothetical protein|nr:hypothetical protein [Treponema sp.]